MRYLQAGNAPQPLTVQNSGQAMFRATLRVDVVAREVVAETVEVSVRERRFRRYRVALSTDA